jgi:protein arginine N-methyltransferase 1
MSLNNMYVRSMAAKDLMDHGASARRWDAVDLREANASVRRGEARWTLARATTVYGFALWWECRLLADISISTSPLAPPSHWDQLYCPVREPITARAGDELSITLTSDSRYNVGASVSWDLRLCSTATGVELRQSLDTKRGNITE